jgi:hypothetical protein
MEFVDGVSNVVLRRTSSIDTFRSAYSGGVSSTYENIVMLLLQEFSSFAMMFESSPALFQINRPKWPPYTPTNNKQTQGNTRASTIQYQRHLDVQPMVGV